MSEEGAPKRPFGLSLPSKPKSKTTMTTTTALNPLSKSCLAAAAFSVDDDDDMDTNPNPAKKPPTSRFALNPKAQRDIEQALEEDPNIYEYDEVYEQVSSTVQQEQKREEKKRLEKETHTFRQPKYVAGLLEKSKQREKEFERVQERRIQRERELEGDMYADKEVFVTPSYKAKLAERQADLEREKLEEKRESMLNVLHQDNMDAFYRFQFKLRTGDATILEESEKTKAEPVEKMKKPTESSTSRQFRTRATNEDDDDDDEQMETNSSTTNQTDMYSRAREKHARDVEREQRGEVKDEPIVDETPKIISKPVKPRRVNDESTQNYDDEQIEMGVGTNSRKKKKAAEAEKKQSEAIDSKENDLDIIMPIASEKKRQAQETRIERIQRLCEKRTVGEVLEGAKQAYFERQQKKDLYKDYLERAE